MKEFYTFLSKGLIKAILIALPISIFLVVPALEEFLVGIVSVVKTHTNPISIRETLYGFYWQRLITGFCLLAGIVGLWLRFLFQEKLAQTSTKFNRIVCFLLLNGVFVGVWLLFRRGAAWPMDVNAITFLLSAYMLWLAYITVSVPRPLSN